MATRNIIAGSWFFHKSEGISLVKRGRRDRRVVQSREITTVKECRSDIKQLLVLLVASQERLIQCVGAEIPRVFILAKFSPPVEGCIALSEIIVHLCGTAETLKEIGLVGKCRRIREMLIVIALEFDKHLILLSALLARHVIDDAQETILDSSLV